MPYFAPSAVVTHYVDWQAVSGATSYNVYANGKYLGNTASTHYSDASGAGTVGSPTPKYTVAAVNGTGTGPQSGAMIEYLYHNGLGVTIQIPGSNASNTHLSALFLFELSFNLNGQDSTGSVLSGHTYSLKASQTGYGGGWQPAGSQTTGWQNYGQGPYSVDIRPFVALTFALNPQAGTDQFDMHTEYNGLLGNNDVQASCRLNDIKSLPGIPKLASGAWNAGITVPLPYLCYTHNAQYYKFFFRELNGGSNSTWYMDDVGFVTGNWHVIYDGGGPVTYSAGAGNWSSNSSALLNSWTDSSNAAVNYSYAAAGLTNLEGGVGGLVGGSANGLAQPGILNSWTNVIQVVTSGNGGYWQVRNTGGVALAGLDHVTLAVLPTNNTHSWTLQALDSNGTPIGNAVTLPGVGTYSDQDHGAGSGAHTTDYTIINVPISALGSIGSTMYGLRLTDTANVGANTFYISAPALYGTG
jgi:hypothetical protein